MTDSTPKGHIYITDDDKFLLDMYSVKFSERGYAVETAFNGQEMIEKLEKGAKPDVCLIDVVMPGMDGFELLAQLKDRKLCDQAAVVILSNLGQREDVDRGVSLGADGYIVKANATPTEVVNKVEEIIKTKNGK